MAERVEDGGTTTAPASSAGTIFAGAIPQLYNDFMVPMLFSGYAADTAGRVAALRPSSVLETAAGSGVVTRALAPLLGSGARYLVSDLNAPMLDLARALQPADQRLVWQVADALHLPEADEAFDVVLCQFGAMFFPDKVRGFAEALRVLKPGGSFIFAVWGSLSHNIITEAVMLALAEVFPDNPPDFIARIPHGYHDAARIGDDLRAAGFANIIIEVVDRVSTVPDALTAATAICQGTPMRAEIEARAPGQLGSVTDRAAASLGVRFGSGPISRPMQALIVTARRQAAN